jgi:hypothetical protein
MKGRREQRRAEGGRGQQGGGVRESRRARESRAEQIRVDNNR